MIRFVKGFFLDPGPGHKPSMTRLCALLLTLYTAWAVVHCGVGMVTALIGGGVVSLLVRHRGGGEGDEEH